MNRTARMFTRSLLAAAVVVAVGAPAARAQYNLKINDSTNVKFGLLLQQWTDWYQPNSAADSSYQQNMFLRRARFLIGGNVTSRLGFFYEVDAANLGRGQTRPAPTRIVKNTDGNAAIFTQDAFFEYRLSDKREALLDGGLILVPLCRNCLNSAASLLSLDYGNYSFVANVPTQSVIGRDLGTQLRGYLVDEHLEYRVGVYSGMRSQQNAANSFRSVGRVQYNFLNTEVAPLNLTYAGTYLGKKAVFAVGTGYDVQGDYKAYAVDAFFDHPVGTDGVTLTADFIHYDGGTALRIVKQDTYHVEGAYYFSALKVAAFGRIEGRNADATSAADQKERRYQLGGTYYAQGHNFNVKAAYSRNSFDTFVPATGLTGATNDQNQFTVQMQAFVF